MRIVITDTGYVWNHENPFLEQFKDIVLVVCLNGKKVTDQYQCFVSPYKHIGMGIDRYGIEDQKLQTLASVAEKLNKELEYSDDIIFLSDSEPCTLYPYYIIKDLNKYNRLHLVAISPWSFESSRRRNAYSQMLADLSALDSLLYFDGNSAIDIVGWKSTISEGYDYMRNYLGELMPIFLNGIYKMKNRPCFFDFASNSYIPLKNGFPQIELGKEDQSDKEIHFPVRRKFPTLGVIIPPSYPQNNDNIKKEVEKPAARFDGKKVCNILREQRIRLAQANNIPFKSKPCPSIGPCAGTCEKCDMESDYLRKQIEKIPEEQRIYPKFDPEEEMLS